MNWEEFGLKQYSNSVKISGKNTTILDDVREKIEEIKNCFDHQMFRFTGTPYKSYRRGKSRCHKCGSKL